MVFDVLTFNRDSKNNISKLSNSGVQKEHVQPFAGFGVLLFATFASFARLQNSVSIQASETTGLPPDVLWSTGQITLTVLHLLLVGQTTNL